MPETPESHHIHQLKKTIDALKTELDALLHIFQHEFHVPLSRNNLGPVPLAAPGTVLEGVFNGYQMIAANGACYPIPPNYASKSKLVEGDLMKLTITRNGGLMYKQIQPIERTRISGILTKDSSTNDWMVGAEQKIYRVLTASVTFYKGQTGDTAGILVPLDGQSDWAAVDYIVHSE
ncbi:MAG: hypothetical protein A3G08_03100 [Candidatus Magasanikbacteria bacterium RIFCSPLOWO2_12_FULL_47_9b]|nr:MAG: hypothetical protein A3I74_00670 [Candidatus Magasanikbacteria bacterium RIFCSPLOWO2_02_FULL_47_16]OGH80154.1 MAG: hypothetical protein A3C10_02555 [Candidatus Magasanikbacteria bacterium RIFCSPHIGHO2_02_FULL_48_18]OGH81856.1 MAG: hypothetical protein A3G08_03100 [Candidatus Magasanikbacteria bacterium RIFCSPLOWO2_12_FULL_47_9b]